MNLTILRLAALLVPRAERRQWLDEWRAELWYVLRRRPRAPRGARHGATAALFCLGAFRDAAWLRRHAPPSAASRLAWLRDPLPCVLGLAVAAIASITFALHLPWPYDTALPSPYRDARSLVMISPAGKFAPFRPAISPAQYRSLSDQNRIFSAVAFYRPAVARVHNRDLHLAIASANFFDLLGIPVPAGPGPRLVLSRAAWRKCFHSDSRVPGSTVRIFGRPAFVSPAIVPDVWRLPGRAEAWLLVDEATLAALPDTAAGFALGRTVSQPLNWIWHISIPNLPGKFECASLERQEPLAVQLLILAMALLILSATTSFYLGEYPALARRPRVRCWLFLGAKVALAVPIVIFGSLSLAPILGKAGFQAHVTLIGYILALRWALTDQRRRCPVCLRLLTNPVRIGQASQTFLEWYGTELICTHGHGLLHVPEIPTISFRTQRWLAMDPSWQSLFSGGRG
jgi:hypothetical protein